MLTQEELIRAYLPADMPPTKIKGFLCEFPWVKKYVRERPINLVYASKLEVGLLNYRPKGLGNAGNGYGNEYIYLLDEEKSLITITTIISKRKYWVIGPMIEVSETRPSIVTPEESVYQVLQSMGKDVDKIHFVMSYSIETCAVIIYKLPKNLVISAWLESEAQKEKEAFHQRMESDATPLN